MLTAVRIASAGWRTVWGVGRVGREAGVRRVRIAIVVVAGIVIVVVGLVAVIRGVVGWRRAPIVVGVIPPPGRRKNGRTKAKESGVEMPVPDKGPVAEMLGMPTAKALPMATAESPASASSAGNRATWGSAASAAYPAPASSPLGEGSRDRKYEQKGESDGDS